MGNTSGPGIRTMPITMALAGKPPSTRTGALQAADLQLVDRTARRLHEAIRAFLGACPDEARNASGLSRLLGIDRTTCQRAVFATGSAYTGPMMIERLPGVKGMRAMVEAARDVEPPISADATERLEAAVDQYAHTLDRVAGSVAELLRRIEATPLLPEAAAAGSGSGDRASSRERLFEASAEVTGRCSECWVAVYVYHPDPERSSVIHIDRVNGLVGHVARPDAVPLTFHSFTSTKKSEPSDQPSFRPLVERADDGSPATVLTRFSSTPLPVVSTRQPNEFMVQAIDADPDTIGHPVDLMFGTRGQMPHPAKQSPPIEEAWALVNFPARTMLFDIYLHRELARQCIPSLDAHLWRPDFAQQSGDRWQTRFADSPKLQLLGAGLANATAQQYARHVELTGFLFDQIGVNSANFIGYRCEVAYPMWRTGYCVGLDFSGSNTD
jgi:hypothetical protein